MAEIIPFRAWHYKNYEKLAERTASISETKSLQTAQNLYQIPYHNFKISSPEDAPPFEKIGQRVHQWKRKQVIEQDILPAFYAYAQEYSLKNSPEKIRTRKGIIAMIRLYDWKDEVILPHEKTIQKAVQHRLELLKATQMHTVPTHGIYEDEHFQIEKFCEEALSYPMVKIQDSQGVRHSLALIQDLNAIRFIQKIMQDKQIFIADGHHRYESSWLYAQEQNLYNSDKNASHNFHLCWLTNAFPEEDGILPTHRVLQNIPNFSEQKCLEKLTPFFHIEQLDRAEMLLQKPYEKAWAFGLIFPENAFYIKLKQEAWNQFAQTWNEVEVVKQLDIAVMQHFIFEKALGLEGQKLFEYLDFEQYSADALQQIKEKKAQAAILTHKIPFTEIKQICLEGQTMPAKSTYFFPKVLSGLLFASIQKDEFYFPKM